jgi:hypothetical protein
VDRVVDDNGGTVRSQTGTGQLAHARVPAREVI